jgi:hypothetical protein
MITNQAYFRPQTLLEGQRYSRMERGQNGDGTTYAEVLFIAYTSCPAVVIISNGSGHKFRCLREDLFMRVSVHNESHIQ